MRTVSRTHDEKGIALVAALLITLLMSGLAVGMFAALNADAISHSTDRDQSQVYAAAHAGLEKVTTDLAQLFVTDFAPSASQISGLSAHPPDLDGFDFKAPGSTVDGTGYAVTFSPDASGNPASSSGTIAAGPFSGLVGLITPYALTVTARSSSGHSEVRLRRDVQTVAVPVFQFGIFGEKSLAFHAGSDFNFGGRVHTNSHLFLAHGASGSLTFTDKITVVGKVVRKELENTRPITTSTHTGPVNIPVVIGVSTRALGYASTVAAPFGEGSVQGGPSSATNAPWFALSTSTYRNNIRTSETGARRLDLPLVSQGAVPVDLIRRPELGSNEDTANAPVFGQRYFAQASLRILLSDRAADLTTLPTITATAPLQLNGDWIATPPFAGYVVGAGKPPLARAIGAGSTAVVAGSTYVAPNHQIRVTDTAAGIPAVLKLPATMTTGAITITNCTGKTASTFTGCTVTGGTIAAGSTIAAVLQSGVTVTATTNATAVTAGAGKTITASTATGFRGFTHDLTWINERVASRLMPMSCEGYSDVSPRALTNCRIWDPSTSAAVTSAQTTAGRTISTYSLSPATTSLVGGFLKIEKQNATGVWSDVTNEILNLGFAAPNQEGTICADPTPDAVIRFQRLRDNGGACNYAGSSDSRDYWPNVLFDAREATYRDVATTAPMTMGGIMNYVTIDVANLKKWFAGTTGTTGTQAWNNNGYIVYFSDRRGNHNDAVAGSPETGEYGNEDTHNNAAGAASSAANGTLDPGEDRNESGTLQTYGALASAVALYGATAPFNAAATPLTAVNNHPEARVNRQVLFRRALKVVRGGIVGAVNNLPDAGLTITTENGIYVQGDYNATSASVTAEPNRPAAIIADAITILSNSWSDHRSLNNPNDYTQRDATTTGYRFAMIAGKSLAFPIPSWATLGNWGSDGGVHNFMRMLEDWSPATTRYRGSMISLYTARQMNGIFKNNSNVYTQGARAFNFDTDFLTPTLLPPGTPMFRDVNTLKFRQILRPNQ